MDAKAQSHSPASKAPSFSASGRVLQRNCGCGQHTIAGAECDGCAKKHSAIQSKLLVGPSSDRFEQEADRVADVVMRRTAAPHETARVVQREAALVNPNAAARQLEVRRAPLDEASEKEESAHRESGVAADIEAEIDSMRGGGQPLPGSVRALFEPRFGNDFGHVRMHTDANAAAMARALNARAFTLGRDIVFGAGEYAPETATGRHLFAHELTHVVQQGGGGPIQRTPDRETPRGPSPKLDPEHKLIPGASSIRLILPDGSERFIRPPAVDTSGPAVKGESSNERETEEPVGPRIQRVPENTGRVLRIQRTATFTNPTPKPQDPLARLVAGQTPGLTTPTINSNVVPSLNDVVKEIVPTQITQSGGAAGKITCQAPRNFKINTSANVIVATNAGANGWVGKVPPSLVGNPQVCAGRPQIPTTMTAGNNADFVARVQASEQQHVDEIHTLHTRHFVPYDKFLMGISGTGVSINACGQNLASQLGERHLQAAWGFTLGYAAATEKLDGKGGTHADNATPTLGPNCDSMTLTLSQTNPKIAGSAPGNVVKVSPKVTTFSPAKLQVVGNDLKDGQTVVKHFTSSANATRALQVIKQYGLTTRNVIGPMEYFLAAGKAPSGNLKGANELAIDPAMYQVTLNVPTDGDWAISEAVGNNINVLVNFKAERNAAYSANDALHSFGFTKLVWVGGTRQAPEMLYFRI